MNPSNPDTPSHVRRLRSLGESPWFWAVLIVNGAILGLLLIAPKYREREAMLERRYGVRREIAERRATGQPPLPASNVPADPHAQDRPLLVPLWRLLTVLVVLDVAALVVFVWRQRRLDALWKQTEKGAT